MLFYRCAQKVCPLSRLCDFMLSLGAGRREQLNAAVAVEVPGTKTIKSYELSEEEEIAVIRENFMA